MMAIVIYGCDGSGGIGGLMKEKVLGGVGDTESLSQATQKMTEGLAVVGSSSSSSSSSSSTRRGNERGQSSMQ